MSAPLRRGRALLGLLLLACGAMVVAVVLLQGGTAAGPTGSETAPTQAATAPGAGPVATPAAAGTPTPESGLPSVTESELPAEARATLGLIRDGGPFPFRQDDTTFFNREGILPDRPSGYYREYTVVTRGSPDRGARRIVAGAEGDLYYTDDHYDSFRQIAQGR